MKHRYCIVLYIFLYCFVLVWRCVIANCGTNYTASSGQISPPYDYTGDYVCSPYTIRLPVGKRIHLEWQKFNFSGIMPSCEYEFVRISMCTDPVKYLIRYCGPLLPNDFYSYDNCIMIDFRTADGWSKPEDREEEKFLLRYETLDVSKPLYPVRSYPDCFNILGRESDNTTTIYTPGWPLSYNTYLHDDFCKTTITFRKNWKMKIVFMGIDLYTPFRTNPRICEDARNDVLTITTYRKGDSHSDDLHYCAKQKPFTRYYDGWLERVDITFRRGTSDVHNHTGFALGIALFDHSVKLHQELTLGNNRGITYTASSGQISPPYAYRGGYIYSPYTIRLPIGKRIHLEWQKFNFAGIMPGCKYEFVRISRCTNPVTHLIRYCGPLLPHDFYSYDNCIMIDFRTKDRWSKPEDRQEEKFLLRYETLDASTPLYPVGSYPDCFNIHGRESDNTTTIYTPGWPLSYNTYVHGFCKTTITFREDWWKMEILFMGIDLYTPFRTNPRICEDARNDVLTITTYTRGTPQSRKQHFCAKQKPFTRYYDHWLERVDITFRRGTSDVHNHTGFALGIALIGHTVPTITPVTLGVVTAICVALVVLLCCLISLKKKIIVHGGLREYINFVKEERRGHKYRELREVVKHRRISNATTVCTYSAPPYPPPQYANIFANKQDGGITPHSNTVQPPVPTMMHQPPPSIPPSYPDVPPSYGPPHPNAPPLNTPHYGVSHPTAPPMNVPQYGVAHPNAPPMNAPHYGVQHHYPPPTNAPNYGAPHASSDNPPSYNDVSYEHDINRRIPPDK